ncbi:MAG: hypothetical protein HW405_218 [Candidatus Berkelbacteria bacterium]|nr:hypothetical protein [Candidatus Berkelbacteria bacterium]
MTCDFSYKHYREILKKALNKGFIISNFKNSNSKRGQKQIILRHDIDYIPYRALKIAQIEKSLGIYSTFFVRVHGEYYHPFEKKVYPIMSQIRNMGHEIGLHTEARNLSEGFKTNIKELFLLEKNILEKIFDLKIVSAAEHGDIGKPKNFWQNEIFTILNKKEVKIKFCPSDFKDYKYISDSLGKWKEGCLCQNLDTHDKIQSLTHPDLWGEGANEELRKLIKDNPQVPEKHKKTF